MGWRFELKYANIVAYLTIPNTVPPRLRVGEVRNFLGSTKGAYRGRKPFISARRSWIARI